jgi:putative sigma-54 modulation protein
MKFTYTEKKFQSTDDLRKYAEKKVGKLDRFFKGDAEAYITFSIERNRHKAEITISNNGMIFRGSETTNDMYATIDSAIEAIEHQIRKNKTRLEKRLREGSLVNAGPVAVVEEEKDFDIVRTKRFSIKPMTAEEAILQMNLLGHEFYVFKNQDLEDEFCVVYKRKQGGYGLIESID